MNKNFGTERGERVRMKVIWATLNASISEDSWIWVLEEQMIKTDFNLREKLVSDSEREVRGGGGQCRYKMVLAGAN